MLLVHLLNGPMRPTLLNSQDVSPAWEILPQLQLYDLFIYSLLWPGLYRLGTYFPQLEGNYAQKWCLNMLDIEVSTRVNNSTFVEVRSSFLGELFMLLKFSSVSFS